MQSNLRDASASCSVLVVDDDIIAIRVLREALHHDAKVRFATNGADALRLARESPPDLILLDGELPGENGFEVCAKLKADDALRAIPVIFVTAHSDFAFETRALELGAADFIAKPIHPALVLLRVRLHLRLKQQLDELRRLSSTDALTRLANRRCFDERLASEWKRAQRSGRLLGLLLIDVDFFKPFNDAYGHQAGDRCLARVAGAIARCAARPHDLSARIGGEEFAVLLPDTPYAGGLAVANSVRDAVNAEAVPHAHSSVADHVTVSIGVACATPLQVDAMHSLFEAADRALYAAKSAGRNRVLTREDIEPPPSHIRATIQVERARGRS